MLAIRPRGWDNKGDAIQCLTGKICTMTCYYHQPPNYSQKGGLVMVQNHDALRCFDEDGKYPKPSSRIFRRVSQACLNPALGSLDGCHRPAGSPWTFRPSSPQFSPFLAACIPGVEFWGQRSAKPKKVIVWVDAGCTATGVGCRFIAITC